MDYTQTYNLSTATKPTAVIYLGKHCKIEDLFLYCNSNATITMYIKEYLTSKDVNGLRRTNTYYIYNGNKLYAGMQYNKFLPEYDAANREWVPANPPSKLEFKLPYKFRLYVTCAGTGGEIDVLCNVKNLDPIRNRKRKTEK